MRAPITAGIAVENTAYSFDKLFDYLIPEELADRVAIGCRVLVDFGRGAKKRQGIVFTLSCEPPATDKKLKKISSVLDEEPLLSDEMIALASFLADRTFCTLFEAAKALLPSGICLRVTETYRCLLSEEEEESASLSQNERDILRYLRRKDDFVSAEKIYEALGLSPETKAVEALQKKGFLLRNVDTKRRLHDATVKMVRLAPEYEEEDSVPFKLTAKQSAVVKFLREIGSATTKEIAYFTGVTQVVTENLHTRGIVVYEELSVYRTPEKMRSTPRDTSSITLSPVQTKAYEKLLQLQRQDEAKAALLFGVTGSGKTKVYMKLIDAIAPTGRGVIVLVPEISLTPQLLTMFYARYGERVAVLHSGLSLGERMDEWKRIRNGDATIVIGTRSASFAPVRDLALMILDEEQESTYKSEMTPRYHARDVARFRAAYHKSLLILASATPSVETFAGAVSGRYELVELPERYSGAMLPQVMTVDISQKQNMNGMQTISAMLAEEMRKNLEQKQQTILLINRRGFHTFVACTKCKEVMMCPHCSISMTYHSANDRLMCHYCGYSEPVRTTCPSCGAETIRFSGFGTQKVEQEVAYLFPEARVLRMDADTTSAKNSHDKAFSRFAQGEYDVMIGTQMVAKGLDFPNVTLVGVISVDQQLYNDDYKSTERTFDLLTQVVGRSGRGQTAGRAVIQTLAPENAVIELAAQQDYRAFFDTEICIRRAMIYPPYCDICVIGFIGPGEAAVRAASRYLFGLLKDKLQTEEYSGEKVVILGPAVPKVAKISNRYRERMIIKCRNSAVFRKMIAACLKEFSTNKVYHNITAYADMNPESIY